MKVRELLKLVPNELLDKTGKEVTVDKNNQRLTGERIFKTLLYSLAETDKISLRSIELIYDSSQFQSFIGEAKKSRHSSFAD